MFRENGLLSLFSGDGRRGVAVIEAYIDESGTDDYWPCVSVAGYFASHDQWTKFEQSWRQELEDAKLDCFHAVEPRCDALWPSMLQHIHVFGLRGLLVTVPKAIYQKATSHGLRSSIGNPYAVAAFACAMKIGEYARAQGLGLVSFVLESGQPNVQFVRATIEAMIDDPEFNVAAVAVATKREFVPLQTADFLAHIAATYHQQWLDVLVGEGPGKAGHGHLTEPLMTDLSAHLDDLRRRQRHEKVLRKSAARSARRAASPPDPVSGWHRDS